MSFGSFFKKLFSHVNPHNLAGALAAAKVTIDQFAEIEHWPWIAQFDLASTNAITALNNWQKGEPTTEIREALELSVSIIQGADALTAKDKRVIAIYVGSAEAALAFL